MGTSHMAEPIPQTQTMGYADILSIEVYIPLLEVVCKLRPRKVALDLVLKQISLRIKRLW